MQSAMAKVTFHCNENEEYEVTGPVDLSGLMSAERRCIKTRSRREAKRMAAQWRARIALTALGIYDDDAEWVIQMMAPMVSYLKGYVRWVLVHKRSAAYRQSLAQ